MLKERKGDWEEKEWSVGKSHIDADAGNGDGRDQNMGTRWGGWSWENGDSGASKIGMAQTHIENLNSPMDHHAKYGRKHETKNQFMATQDREGSGNGEGAGS